MKKFVPVFLVFLVVLSGLQLTNAGNLQDELKNINNRIITNKRRLTETKRYQDVLNVKEKSKLDEQEKVKGLLDEYETKTASTQQEITETVKRIKESRKSMETKGRELDKKRDEVGKLLTFVHKFSQNRFIDYVFSAESFSELTGRARFTNKILNGTVKAITDLHLESSRIETARQNLEKDKQRLAELKTEYKTQVERYGSLKKKNEQVLNDIKNQKQWTKEELARIQRQLDNDQAQVKIILKKIAEEEERRKRAAYKGAYMWPVTVNGPIGPFGMRKHPIFGDVRMHTGIDIDAKMGAPIVAAGDGFVGFVGWLGGYGNLVILSHGNGVTTFYAHMSRFGCSKGQQVKKGQLIGYIGSTGWSTGPHLHFEYRINDKPMNPLNYLPR
ncbi:MAG: peptidoglycan DD-metalloendopeptidase family protein [Caldisericales bacterium]|nr:peptidoglycan DD-metalloendopeptidase family protein [Caldisericales bacterium]